MAALTLLKTGKNCKMFDDGAGNKLIMIEKCRISYPAIGNMREDENDDGSTKKSYKATPMLSKAEHVDAKNMFVEIMNELMTANKVKIPPEYRCIKNGDDSEKEEYQGHWTINASENRRPTARDAAGKLYFDPKSVGSGSDAQAIFDQIDEVFYGGVWANILLRPWYFGGVVKGKTKTYPKRICCGLTGIQFYKDDKPFGNGRIDDSNVWGDSSDDDGGSSAADDDDDNL